MRITVDIDDATLTELVKTTGEKKKSTAVSKAVTDFVKRRRAREFGDRLMEGAFDYPFTNEEIEKSDK